MRSKLRKVLNLLVPIIFWLSVWQGASMLFRMKYGPKRYKFILPSVFDTFKAFGELFTSQDFYISVLFSLFRVIIALLVGAIIGVTLAYASYKIEIVRMILSPFFSIMRSTPIASIVIVLYVIIKNSDFRTVTIAVLMVAPIIWQNVLDSFSAIPKDLSEVCDSYQVPRFTKLRILVFPTLLRFLIPAVITSSSLCWKATISAEIIVYAERSIGYIINVADDYSQSWTVFACTIVVIVLSILFEKGSKLFLGRCEKWL